MNQDAVEGWLLKHAPANLDTLGAWRLMKLLYDPPEPMVNWRHGKIQFRWSYSNVFLELEVESDGNMLWYAKNRQTAKISASSEERPYYIQLLCMAEWFRLLRGGGNL